MDIKLFDRITYARERISYSAQQLGNIAEGMAMLHPEVASQIARLAVSIEQNNRRIEECLSEDLSKRLADQRDNMAGILGALIAKT